MSVVGVLLHFDQLSPGRRRRTVPNISGLTPAEHAFRQYERWPVVSRVIWVVPPGYELTQEPNSRIEVLHVMDYDWATISARLLEAIALPQAVLILHDVNHALVPRTVLNEVMERGLANQASRVVMPILDMIFTPKIRTRTVKNRSQYLDDQGLYTLPLAELKANPPQAPCESLSDYFDTFPEEKVLLVPGHSANIDLGRTRNLGLAEKLFSQQQSR
jgi:2-C-methyl-D-erythritol 4-phosphate cytidylyltransferase